MTFTATISEPNEPDAMPMWESFDHPTADDAYRAAKAHVHNTQQGDRIVDQGHGVYAIWSDDDGSARTPVATLVIAGAEQ
jgi:hypothetical protein